MRRISEEGFSKTDHPCHQAVTKPKLGLKQFLSEASDELVHTVRAAARANVHRLVPGAVAAPVVGKQTADAILPPATRATQAMTQTTERVVALGTSTGGTQALEEVLTALPRPQRKRSPPTKAETRPGR